MNAGLLIFCITVGVVGIILLATLMLPVRKDSKTRSPKKIKQHVIGYNETGYDTSVASQDQIEMSISGTNTESKSEDVE